MVIFAYHSYHDDNNPEIRRQFKSEIVEKYPQFRFDMSEWCELPNKSHTKNFKGALITARIIGQDLAYAGAQSWTSWVAVNQFSIKEDGNDYSDATITATNAIIAAIADIIVSKKLTPINAPIPRAARKARIVKIKP